MFSFRAARPGLESETEGRYGRHAFLLSRCLCARDVHLDVASADRGALFEFIACRMADACQFPASRVAAALARRESVGSTALGEGTAIPHARVQELDRVHAHFVRLAQPIPYDAPDGKPVRLVMALLVPAPALHDHLIVLSEAASVFAQAPLRRALLAAETPEEVVRIVLTRREDA